MVDDEDLVCRLFEAMFPGQVTALRTGHEALALLDSHRFDVVVTDFHMPDLPGDRLLGAIRAHWPGIPVVIMTGYGQRFGSEDAIGMGAADYLPKPFRQQEVKGRIEAVLQRSWMETCLHDYEACLASIHSLLESERESTESLVDQVRRSVDDAWAKRAESGPPVLNAPSTTVCA